MQRISRSQKLLLLFYIETEMMHRPRNVEITYVGRRSGWGCTFRHPSWDDPKIPTQPSCDDFFTTFLGRDPTYFDITLQLPFHTLEGIVDGFDVPFEVDGDLLIGSSVQVQHQHLTLQIAQNL